MFDVRGKTVNGFRLIRGNYSISISEFREIDVSEYREYLNILVFDYEVPRGIRVLTEWRINTHVALGC